MTGAHLRNIAGSLSGSIESPQDAIRLLQEELTRTSEGLLALALELEQKVEESTQALIATQRELERTNSELLHLTLELEQRVDERTAQVEAKNREILQLNAQLEERVRERTKELEASNRELEAFSYSVSHDLRAPLRHISGFTKLLEEHIAPSLDKTGSEYLSTIAASSRKMGRLIDDLLTFSRMARCQLRTALVDVNTLIEEVRVELQGETAGRKVAWTIHPLPNMPADRSLLKQVFMNLLGNSIKYTRSRETAVIEIRLEAAQPNEHVIAICDNGVGFDMKYADKLFGVFQRLHSEVDFEGTGIGLANVQRIIHRHGGRVWAQGEVGKGAAFFIALPMR